MFGTFWWRGCKEGVIIKGGGNPHPPTNAWSCCVCVSVVELEQEHSFKLSKFTHNPYRPPTHCTTLEDSDDVGGNSQGNLEKNPSRGILLFYIMCRISVLLIFFM